MGKKVTKSMITDFDKFKAAWEKDAESPYEPIMYYLIAALNIEDDPKLADAMMTVVVSKRDSDEDDRSPSGLKLRARGGGYFVQQFAKNPNIARSYVGGTNENDYKFSKSNLAMTIVREQEMGDKHLKIFIQSGGKDNPTPVQVRQNKHGQWKLTEYSSICTGVKKPASEEGDF
ncbi:MAG: hypothetical protein JSW61_14945 [Candidatus Thorarchaeota archaeon]|nr:MAG: hypothetical protein JSW61_14945 [Candidatus Thorarchaeota archaeon]